MSVQPVAHVLQRCAQEAHRQADAATRFDDALGGLALSGATVRAPLWQELDLHRQTLRDLARFLEALASELPESIPIDLAEPRRQLTLVEVANRLAGTPSDSSGRAAAVNGEADWF